MKNKAVMKMAKMAGNNRTAMKLKAEDAAMKMKKQAAMKMAKKDSAMDMGYSPKKMKKGSAMDMGHSPKKMKKNSAMDMKKGPMKMKKNSPMKDNHFKPEKLKQVNVTSKRTKNQKFQQAIKEKHPGLKDMPEGHLYKTGQGDFKKKKGGKIVRRDDTGQGFKSGGGFFNRLKKEGVSSALANTFPVRALRTIQRGEIDR